MRAILSSLVLLVVVPLGSCCFWKPSPNVAEVSCPADSVKVGRTCVDKYEASVWQIPTSQTSLIGKVRAGNVTRDDLMKAAATQLAPATTCTDPAAYGANFPGDGNWTPSGGAPGVYAVSIPGVAPSACITWFQANQACQLSGKRLLTNTEWQGAAAGTPDPGASDDHTTTCTTASGGPANTGGRTSCKSNWGAFDMVGNVSEWVGEWTDRANVLEPVEPFCADWTSQAGITGNDVSCFAGNATTKFDRIPAAVTRGGAWNSEAAAGVFAVSAVADPSRFLNEVGFRCGR